MKYDLRQRTHGAHYHPSRQQKVPGIPFVAGGTLWTRSARSFGCLALVGPESAVNGKVAMLATSVNVTI